MKTLIVGLLFLGVAGRVEAQELPTKEYILARITHYSDLYHVSEGLMTHIVFRESSFNSRAVGDTHLTDPNGNPHISIGLVQINKYWNPDVTEEQARNVDFSLDFLAKRLKQGKCYLWSTCPKK
jgi:hypothetical protein